MTKKVILKGKKVILRPLSLRDAADYCRWLSDPEVTKFLAIHDTTPPTLKEEREWILKARKDAHRVCLAIDTVEGKHIGTVSLEEKDPISKRAVYGIFIGDPEYWGQGYGTEAGQMMVEYGFRKLKLHRIYLQCYAFNIRGQKSYEKIGFRVEGRHRQHRYRNGYWHDEILMGILRDEYFTKHKKH